MGCSSKSNDDDKVEEKKNTPQSTAKGAVEVWLDYFYFAEGDAESILSLLYPTDERIDDFFKYDVEEPKDEWIADINADLEDGRKNIEENPDLYEYKFEWTNEEKISADELKSTNEEYYEPYGVEASEGIRFLCYYHRGRL